MSLSSIYYLHTKSMYIVYIKYPLMFQVHHEKELEHLKRMMDRKEEELVKNQTQERKALPKRIRQEMKAREMMFRESMRISVTNLHEAMKPMEEKDRLKKVLNPSFYSSRRNSRVRLQGVHKLINKLMMSSVFLGNPHDAFAAENRF